MRAKAPSLVAAFFAGAMVVCLIVVTLEAEQAEWALSFLEKTVLSLAAVFVGHQLTNSKSIEELQLSDELAFRKLQLGALTDVSAALHQLRARARGVLATGQSLPEGEVPAGSSDLAATLRQAAANARRLTQEPGAGPEVLDLATRVQDLQLAYEASRKQLEDGSPWTPPELRDHLAAFQEDTARLVLASLGGTRPEPARVEAWTASRLDLAYLRSFLPPIEPTGKSAPAAGAGP